MDGFEQVERRAPATYFEVVHHQLRAPRGVYLQNVSTREPFSELGAQDFMARYLKSQGDTDGIIGMVRWAENGGEVWLDAAVRYPLTPEDKLT
jgi:hypothetical protein